MMRVVVRVLGNLLVSLVAIFAILGPAPTNASTDLASCLLIENAQIDLSTGFNQGIFGHANFGHEIQSGSHAVIAIRRIGGAEGSVDSQSFSKTTIEIKSLPPDSFTLQGRSIEALRSFHTEGSAGFVPKGQYLWSGDPLHTVWVSQDAAGLHLVVRSEFEQELARDGRHYPGRVEISCQLRKLPVAELRPWEGKPGTDWTSFNPQGH
jgi:hypothetical protein